MVETFFDKTIFDKKISKRLFTVLGIQVFAGLSGLSFASYPNRQIEEHGHHNGRNQRVQSEDKRVVGVAEHSIVFERVRIRLEGELVALRLFVHVLWLVLRFVHWLVLRLAHRLALRLAHRFAHRLALRLAPRLTSFHLTVSADQVAHHLVLNERTARRVALWTVLLIWPAALRMLRVFGQISFQTRIYPVVS